MAGNIAKRATFLKSKVAREALGSTFETFAKTFGKELKSELSKGDGDIDWAKIMENSGKEAVITGVFETLIPSMLMGNIKKSMEALKEKAANGSAFDKAVYKAAEKALEKCESKLGELSKMMVEEGVINKPDKADKKE